MLTAMSEITTNDRDAKNGRFIAGNSGNGGRPRGARSKLTTGFLEDLHSCWERNGADVLERVARDDPAALLRTVAQLMPSDLNVNLSVDPTAFVETFRTACSLLGNPEPPRLRRSLRKQPPLIDHG
jgi:hypothetical protein